MNKEVKEIALDLVEILLNISRYGLSEYDKKDCRRIAYKAKEQLENIDEKAD